MRELSSKNLAHVPKVYEILEQSSEEKCFLLELLGKYLISLFHQESTLLNYRPICMDSAKLFLKRQDSR